ncbi:MAG: SH3 domain-containing protein [Pseudoxanthomonas sp.]
MRIALVLTLLSLLAPSPASARETPPARDTGVLGIRSEQLDPGYWLARLPQPDRVVLSREAIAAQNAKLYAADPTMHDLSKLPEPLSGVQVREWVEALRPSFDKPLFDERGQPLDLATLSAGVETGLNLVAVGRTVVPRFALVVRRADLRAVPDRRRVFRDPEDHDIDRWQESALFPGTPVAIVHESGDGQWAFVVAPNYAAWVEKQYLAEGARDAVLGYGRERPHIVVTGANVRTTFTPEQPRVSSLQLDMGLRLPLLDRPPREAVNGQDAYASYVVELPVRDADGRLQFAPALVPRSADVSGDYLPLTQANLLRQGFKFLGERYGWGHSYGTRDCSGFVSEIYRSFGVQLPRNTSAQAVSPALNRIAVGKDDDRARRLALMQATLPGDLIYIPGHVMMVIGHEDGRTWVIHDTAGATWLDADGQRLHADLNGVSVTPFETMLAGGEATYADRITNLQRIRP